ncbi:ABC transporter ATP-binding protein [Rhizomonospora bruguierae]|uniref:ABC transporter ATP-binding protein n=1 Tax=Rhizomonospora bruguierae TaxID=1581705 RepID=UPI001BCAC514|nr:ATP-binding cassette domain-containing protein [Micromonospora sp. NBRC 107566]
MLTVRDVTVRFKGVTALEDVGLDLQRGRVHGVIGPNGAGKSTFVDVVSGRRRGGKASIVFDGENVAGRSVTWRRRHGIARSFQRTSVFPDLTVRAHFELVARTLRDESVDELIDALGLGPLLDRKCGQVSYGDQRRVDIGMALVGGPAVLLADEPGAGLSRSQSLELARFIRQLARERDMAVLYIEHDVDAVFEVCDDITVLNLGRVLMSGSPAEVRQDNGVRDAYLGREG